MSWFNDGFKRLASGLISTLLEILRGLIGIVPGVEIIIQPLEIIAGALGVAGVGHATVKRTVSKKALTTAAAILSVLIAIAPYVPPLAPYMPILQKIAAALGAAALGSKIAVETDNKNLA